MLQKIRERSQGWLAWIIILTICVTFALWGVHSYITGNNNSGNVATVNGESINQSQLTASYERLRRQQQFQLGANFTPNQSVESDLKKQALEQLILNHVLIKAAQADGYRVNQIQVDQALIKMPAFQVDGQFSQQRFREVLGTILYSDANFLNDLQNSMLINQVQAGFVDSEFSLPTDVATAIQLVDQKRDIAYLLIQRSAFTGGIVIPDSAVENYYKEHQADFALPEQVSIDYLQLSMTDLINSVPVDENKIAQYYKDNQDSFKQQPLSKVHDQIQRALAQQITQQTFADKSDKLTNLTYVHPDTLADAAKTLGLTIKSSDLFTRQGGQSGIAANPKIIAAAFSADVLNHGNNSDVIEIGNDNLVVLRIKAHKPAQIKPLADVQSEVREMLKGQMAQRMAEDQTKTILTRLQQGVGGKQLAKEYNLQWIFKPEVGRYDTTLDTRIRLVAFRMARPVPNKFSTAGIAMPGGGYAVVAVTGVHDGDIKKAPDSKQRIFQEQIENSLGQLDYELYVHALLAKAKVDIKDSSDSNTDNSSS
jgi:peptidyl-prolyl cis-trans isomerase D